MREQWVEAAESCLRQGVNLMAAYQILIIEAYDEYFQQAETFLETACGPDEWWGQEPVFIYASFPSDHPLKKERPFLQLNKLERQAMIRAEDPDYCRFLGHYIDEVLGLRSIDDASMEMLVTLAGELGNFTEHFVQPSHLERLKGFVSRYLENDQAFVLRLLNDPVFSQAYFEGYDDFDTDGRGVWIYEEAPFIAWRLGWTDLFDHLCGQWYWLVAFDKQRQDDLLAWSTYPPQELVMIQALLECKAYDRVERAVAWKRLRAQKP